MRFLLIFIISFSIISFSHAQNGIKIDGLIFFQLGDSLKKFSGKLICIDYYKKPDTLNVADEINCETYTYILHDGDSILAGPVNFSNISVIRDSINIIETIFLSKYYLKKNQSNSNKFVINEYKKPKKMAEKEFRFLRNYLTNLLNTKGEIYNHWYGKIAAQEETGHYWIKNNRKYLLRLVEPETGSPGVLLDISKEN